MFLSVSIFTPLCLAALIVAPSDRLSMADRLFGRGDYAAAKREYLALKGVSGVDEADVLYRLVASSEGMKDLAGTRQQANDFLSRFPRHALAERVRLMKALAGNENEKKKELSDFIRDAADTSLRAEAMFHLARLTSDAMLYDRCRKIDPKGRYAPYASFKFASVNITDKDPAVRRKGLAELMELVYGKDLALAKDSLYLAAVHSYREGRYGESVALLKRYMKLHPGDSRIQEVNTLTALSELMAGRYSQALSFCNNDDDETLLFVKAMANDNLGEKIAAAQAAKRYIEKFPQGANIQLINLLQARLEFDEVVKTKDTAKILELSRRAALLPGAGAADMLRYAWALESAGRVEEAEERYAAVSRDYPGGSDAAEATYRRAMSLLRREKWQAAELSLAESIATGKLSKERNALALYWRGVSSVRAGHAEKGVEYLKAAVKESLPLDESREARLMIADADFNAGRTLEAKKEYSLLVREGALVRMSAAKALAVGRILEGEEAKLCAQSLIKSDSPQWRQAGFALLGEIEEKDGAFGAAVYSYTKAMEEPCVTESLAKVSLRLGVLEVRGGDYKKAEKALKKAVELNAENGEARAEAYLTLSRASLLRNDIENARAYATVVTALFDKTKFAEEAEKILKENAEERQ
jgi:outer membrane protein assembly factor BamD (BamD/ComL family)